MLRLDPEPLPAQNSDPALLGEATSFVLAFALVLVAAAGAVLLARLVYHALARRLRSITGRSTSSSAKPNSLAHAARQ